MNDQDAPENHVLAALRELVKALDHRIPHVERAGELRIGQEAAALRRDAVTRIEALLRARPEDRVYDEARADAEMTDDGNPTSGEGTRRQPA